ncbi:unnamed protein product [Chondrus crispus]|uniref:Uncharacterized protein n=1 Tax=Chondrus crispus TaxID=2769 RepID=R7Q478_CHOCR|nr:unnamed protein product [Chondrus crispus]CDF32280.1 unnamed protein product [Chondrus crispus]|eukprot:XP_005711945.1 unnamed protein product [Chondrus crispus]
MAGVPGRSGKNSKAVREFKATGNKAMQSGAFQKAMRLYTRALDLDPANSILYSNRSAAHFNLRQFSESLDDAESAILCDAMWWKAYKRKGLALIHMQRYEEAIHALEEGLRIIKKNAEMEKNLEFAKACQEQAQNLYILPEPVMMQRLESVPVFIVTDNVGQPFFVTYDDGQQVCTFYFDQEDANSTLEWIKSENPGLGDTARVIHITLHQAFNLAQETQKQYYEETTRAAAEEDIRAAAEAAATKGGKGTTEPVLDVDGDETTETPEEVKTDDDTDMKKEKDKDSSTQKGDTDMKKEKDEDSGAQKGDTDPAQHESNAEVQEKSDSEKKDTAKADGEKDGSDQKDEASKEDDSIIDENAPLSFQFRPELRQVKVAVELLNQNPDPPVKPILRDPPSVRKAKAEAAAAAAAATSKEIDNVEGAGNVEKPAESEDKKEEAETETKDEVEGGEGKAGADKPVDDDEDVELTVDNFNGIPIFQAKGLTLLQKNKQLIPLFFSKWDLEDAWKQLKESNAMDVPKECEIDVGTLEEVLRRMSESKTGEFQSVFFVPSRESMKAINVKFPLDDLASSNSSTTKNALGGKPSAKKAGFSKAKQVAARGGTKDEIRAAIREDIEKHAERQKMAEIIAQIEHAGRTGSVNGLGQVPPTGNASSAK